jgi:hypothetical protein
MTCCQHESIHFSVGVMFFSWCDIFQQNAHLPHNFLHCVLKNITPTEKHHTN